MGRLQKIKERVPFIIFAIGIITVALLYLGQPLIWKIYTFAPRYGIMERNAPATRTKVSYAERAMRDVAGKMSEYFDINQKVFPGRPYWGPLDEGLIAELGYSYGIPIDPFNLPSDRSLWGFGEEGAEDRGAVVRIKGSNYHLYSNGKDFWMLLSFGPDERLSITQDILEEFVRSEDRDVSKFNQFGYDVTNGTISQGDIWRMK